jgi:hypothetical protein
MNGTKDSSQMHMDGLVKMIALRGGLTSFQSNPVLQRVLTWFVALFSGTNMLLIPVGPTSSIPQRGI